MTTVTHSKVSGIADGGDTTLVRPSDWNADHVIVGGPVAMTTVVAELSADFTTASDSAWHDITGLTGISLAAGTWIALVDIENATAAAQYSPAFRLTDGTNTYAQANEFNTYVGTPLGVHTEFAAKPFVLGSTTSLKLQVFSDTVFTIKKYPVRGADTGVIATKITFLKIDGTAVTPGVVLLEQHTASSSTTLDFTTAITSLYDEYIVEFLNVTPATDGAELLMRVSQDGGSTWDATAGRYYYNSSRVSGATWTAYNGGGSATSLGLAHNIANSIAPLGATGSLRVLPTGSNQRWVIGQLHYIPSGADRSMSLVNGDYENSSFNAMRFLFSTGNILSGIVRVYGVTK